MHFITILNVFIFYEILYKKISSAPLKEHSYTSVKTRAVQATFNAKENYNTTTTCYNFSDLKSMAEQYLLKNNISPTSWIEATLNLSSKRGFNNSVEQITSSLSFNCTTATCYLRNKILNGELEYCYQLYNASLSATLPRKNESSPTQFTTQKSTQAAKKILTKATRSTIPPWPVWTGSWRKLTSMLGEYPQWVAPWRNYTLPCSPAEVATMTSTKNSVTTSFQLDSNSTTTLKHNSLTWNTTAFQITSNTTNASNSLTTDPYTSTTKQPKRPVWIPKPWRKWEAPWRSWTKPQNIPDSMKGWRLQPCHNFLTYFPNQNHTSLPYIIHHYISYKWTSVPLLQQPNTCPPFTQFLTEQYNEQSFIDDIIAVLSETFGVCGTEADIFAIFDAMLPIKSASATTYYQTFDVYIGSESLFGFSKAEKLSTKASNSRSPTQTESIFEQTTELKNETVQKTSQSQNIKSAKKYDSIIKSFSKYEEAIKSQNTTISLVNYAGARSHDITVQTLKNKASSSTVNTTSLLKVSTPLKRTAQSVNQTTSWKKVTITTLPLESSPVKQTLSSTDSILSSTSTTYRNFDVQALIGSLFGLFVALFLAAVIIFSCLFYKKKSREITGPVHPALFPTFMPSNDNLYGNTSQPHERANTLNPLTYQYNSSLKSLTPSTTGSQTLLQESSAGEVLSQPKSTITDTSIVNFHR